MRKPGPLENAEAEGAARSVYDECLKRSQNDLLVFVRGLVIPSAHGKQLFDDCIEPFQVETFEHLAPSFLAVRDGRMPPVRRFWVERTKKSGKDSDLAGCLLWLVSFADKPILVQVCAANYKQARIIEDRAADLLEYNPWLGSRVEIVKGVIRSTKRPRTVRCAIEATGSAGTAQGPTPDVLILNELVHVDRWPVMEAHFNNADGVPRGIVIVSTNAGIKGSPAWRWRETALGSRTGDGGRWGVHVWHDRSPWVDPADVEEARQRDPVGSEYKRLWCGVWVSGAGDAVTDEEIDVCFCLEGPADLPKPGCSYVAGLDLGVSHDHAGVALLEVDEVDAVIRIVRIRGFAPTVPNDRGVREVDLQAVEDECFQVHQKYGVQWWGYDPAAGGSFMAQRLRKRGVPMREVTFSSPKNQTDMATSFVTAVKARKLLCYEDGEGRLRRDFAKFNVEHKPHGTKYKLVAVSDEFGHADVGTAVVICLPEAVRLLGGFTGFGPEDVLYEEAEQDWTQKDVEAMPDVLRDIYEAEDSAGNGIGKPRGVGYNDGWD